MVDAPVELTAAEARVLGCLVEKALTTPDVYPLSLNSLRLGCNQTTNRDPVVSYDDATVEEALEGLRAKRLATRGKALGERAIKHRHRVEETLDVDPAERALLCVLLLRGAQTPGELKARTDRLHGFTGTDEVEATLDRLAERGFVHRLERRPGQKESRWRQLLADSPDGGGEAVVAPSASSSAHGAPAATRPSAPEPASPHAPAATATLDVVDPTNGEHIRTLDVDDETEIAGKLRRARAAQPAWSARPYAERAQALLAWRDLLGTDLEECARVTSQETGKTIAAARNEVRAVQARITWFVEHVAEVVASRVETASAEL